MLKRNRLIMLALVLTFVMILSACGGGNNNANTSAQATNNASEGEATLRTPQNLQLPQTPLIPQKK